MVDERRVRQLNSNVFADSADGKVIYWMSRDQRIGDNWALLYAQDLALAWKKPLAVVFCLVPEFLGATLRHYDFMLQGLASLEQGLHELNIGFVLLMGDPPEEMPRFCHGQQVSAVVSDFSPLRINQRWKDMVAQEIDSPFFEVDAHNIIPCCQASPKQEYAAYTFRPKVHRVLSDFLTDIPRAIIHPYGAGRDQAKTDWEQAVKKLRVDRNITAVGWLSPGEKAGQKAMRHFLESKLDFYDQQRNDPTKDGQSGLSPYLHFGQLSAQRLAYETSRSDATEGAVDAFLEELIVRRELSDNFCFYNRYYDSIEGFPRWARETHALHALDQRDYRYSQEDFEAAQTHDVLWNAAQWELVKTGKMHGYMRMYWAKKILEWTSSPQEALAVAIYLNDKYSLDGRDPNGYTGIAWSIGGVHDRAWGERPVFGKVRYMSYKGSKSKFNVDRYIQKVASYTG